MRGVFCIFYVLYQRIVIEFHFLAYFLIKKKLLTLTSDFTPSQLAMSTLVDEVDPYARTLSYHYNDSIISSRTKTGDYTISKRKARTIKKQREDVIITGYIRREYNREIPKSLIKMIQDFKTYFQVLKLSR